MYFWIQISLFFSVFYFVVNSKISCVQEVPHIFSEIACEYRPLIMMYNVIMLGIYYSMRNSQNTDITFSVDVSLQHYLVEKSVIIIRCKYINLLLNRLCCTSNTTVVTNY